VENVRRRATGTRRLTSSAGTPSTIPKEDPMFRLSRISLVLAAAAAAAALVLYASASFGDYTWEHYYYRSGYLSVACQCCNY
jgi:hypothetical protein